MTKRERKALRESIRRGILAEARGLLIAVSPYTPEDMWEDGDRTWASVEVAEDTKAAYDFLRLALRNNGAWGAFWKGRDEA